jgi:hypothetical protein
MISQLTNDHLNIVRNCIFKFKNQKTFCYKEIAKELRISGLKHEMMFYYFVYAKAVVNLSKGVYVITEKINTLTNTEIYRLGTDHIQTLRKQKRKLEIENYNKNNYVKNIDPIYYGDYEQKCISFLKSKGYKIMKPISEYKEV